MDLEGIMLSEIRQRKTNTVWSHLYAESKKNMKLIEKEIRFVVTRGGGGGGGEQELDEGGQKVPTSSYKINEY